jgi:hypothetical protein
VIRTKYITDRRQTGFLGEYFDPRGRKYGNKRMGKTAQRGAE